MTAARAWWASLWGMGLVAVLASSVKADWYAGDPTPTTPVPTAAFYYAPTGFTHVAFENFTWSAGVGGGVVDKVGGNYFSYATNNVPGNITQAYWEIRMGMSAGVAGTLVASGIVTPTIAPTAFTVAGEAVTRVTADVPDFALADGNYWFGMSLKDAPEGGWFVGNTLGAGGIGGPLNDGQTLYRVTDSGGVVVVDYVDLATQYGGDPGLHLDASYFINEVPEPATGCLLAAAGLLLAGRRVGKNHW